MAQVGLVGWTFNTKFDSHSNRIRLHDQDSIYNGKTLINPIDSPLRTSQLGSYVVTLIHLDLVYNKFSCYEHGLKLEDTKKGLTKLGICTKDLPEVD